SFGPGHFCNYDIKLAGYLSYVQGGQIVKVSDFVMYDPFLFDPTRSATYAREGSTTFYDGTGQVVDFHMEEVTSIDGHSAKIVLPTGETFEFELIDTSSGVFEGRLIRMQDHNGYGQTITYKPWTQQELAVAPDRQWQIDQVTDDHGRTLTFSYHSQQVGGRWAVSEIELPDETSITYDYTN